MEDIVKCKVCGSKYPEKLPSCPICKYRESYILEINKEDYEKKQNTKKAAISDKKNRILASLSIALRTYDYELVDMSLKETGEGFGSFGSLEFNKVCWMDEEFETVDTRDNLDATLKAVYDGIDYHVSLSIPNIKKAEYLKLGILIDNDFNVIAEIKDHLNETTKSEKVHLFS